MLAAVFSICDMILSRRSFSSFRSSFCSCIQASCCLRSSLSCSTSFPAANVLANSACAASLISAIFSDIICSAVIPCRVFRPSNSIRLLSASSSSNCCCSCMRRADARSSMSASSSSIWRSRSIWASRPRSAKLYANSTCSF